VDTTTIENYLDSFGKYVVKQARANLTKAKKNDNKDLYNSIKFKVVQKGNKFIVEFYMLYYGKFIDKGVSGNKKKQSYIDYEGKKIKSPGKGYTTKGPPIDIISKWIKRRGIKPKGTGRGRSKKSGQYISGLAYLISKSIKRDGIKSLSFFQRPLGLGLDRLPEEFLGAVKEDINKSLTTVK
tara:strand:+ start:1456 stop:2001 length:546 start_codon:yes stop_codon:yes gene_type:complete